MSFDTHVRELLAIGFAASVFVAGCAGDDGGDGETSESGSETATGDGDGDPTGDGDGDPTGDGDGDPTGDGDGDPTGDGDGDPGVDCTMFDAEVCAAHVGICESVSGAPYEPFMDGWCISDAVEFLGCVNIEDVCDYAGPACSDAFPDTVFEVDGCAPGFSPCEAPMPVVDGCGG
jgi:hypothetical protein